MKQSWTAGLAPDAEKELRGDFVSSQVTRKRLTKLLEDKIASAQKLSITKEGYDVPNWPYRQADNAGYQRALDEVINLIVG